ncbi:MAG: DUF349 domain-containing protein [Herminiimonas sp.]|nr:DUF349 domain-containing protein [Herminiimonas sp.]
MFDFLFKRKTAKPLVTAVPPLPAASPALPGLAKLNAMAQANSLQGEEAAVAFILQSTFADARLAAAAHVQSPALLERVLKGMRDTDRRVVRLMQARLDAIAQRDSAAEHAQRCIDDAGRLLQQAQLLPNQVAAVDRAWQGAGEVSAALRDVFDAVRAALRARLEAQATLQRAVLNTVANLKDLVIRAAELDPAEAALALSTLESEMAVQRAAAEAWSLPPHLASQFDQDQTALRQSLVLHALRHQGLQIRGQKLDEWESLQPDELEREVLRREWQALPAMQHDEASAALQSRFDAVLTRTVNVAPPAPIKAVTPQQDAGQDFAEALEAMEKALEDGAVRLASTCDKAIRTLDVKLSSINVTQSARLARARSELGRLQAWAKWGGTVSREELLKAVEGMAGQEAAPAELAKKVGSLRERWKSLEASAGSAPKELWERFDAACTTAYAPAAEYFKKLAEDRLQNQLLAQSMIADIAAFVTTSHCGAEEGVGADWKSIAQFSLRMTQGWQRLGTIDRRHKKKLDAEFDQAMQLLREPLARQRSLEIARREQLIADVGSLRPTDRSAPDQLRALQERWQEQSRSLPLERRDEQDLWQRFRAACDAVFARRKDAAVTADAGRRENLEAKEILCSALEATLHCEESLIVRTLQQTRHAWSKVGPVSHAAQSAIELRYHNGLAALELKLDSLRSATSQHVADALRAKLAVCRNVEQLLLRDAGPDALAPEDLALQWKAVALLPVPFEQALQKRLDAAIVAVQQSDRSYAASIEANGVTLRTEILRFEILVGIESPASCSGERIRMQVDVLQAALKAGVQPISEAAQLRYLCTLPAATDPDAAVRLDKLIAVARETLSH